jgi:nitrogen regulatory protein P-II 1
MKKIEAIIRPDKLTALTEKLKSMGLKEINTADFNNHDLANDKKEIKTKIEFVLNYAEVDKYVEAVKNTAQTGNPGDGRIFVYDVENAVKIRTGEEGVKAL